MEFTPRIIYLGHVKCLDQMAKGTHRPEILILDQRIMVELGYALCCNSLLPGFGRATPLLMTRQSIQVARNRVRRRLKPNVEDPSNDGERGTSSNRIYMFIIA